jgi:cysteine desulfurase
MKLPVYVDYNATTPIAPQVQAAIRPWLEVEFGNASSAHAYGQRPRQAIALARQEVAALIGATDDEIVFTGSATEADNLALFGVARALPNRRHLVISAVEHPAVMQCALHLRESGWDITIVPVDGTGRVAASAVAGALRSDTALVSIMHANNEVGTLQPVADIARLARAKGVLVHTDAAQSIGKVTVNVAELGVDLLTMAGHKFYAPKGIGALYVRQGTPIAPIQFGGEQEHGLRPGTENVAFIAGFGAACRLARDRLPAATQRLLALRDRLHESLAVKIPGLTLNGHPEHRLPNTLHVSFPDVSGSALLIEAAESVAASVGSACHSATGHVSGVLAAMGLDGHRARGAVRLSVGQPTTETDVDVAAQALVTAWIRLVNSDEGRQGYNLDELLRSQ